MTKKTLTSVTVIGCLIAITCAALAYTGKRTLPPKMPTETEQRISSADGHGLTLSAKLINDKIHAGGDGHVSLALTLTAPETKDTQKHTDQPIDMVVVLDRSGSMSGQKITDARHAVANLVSLLTPKDRFALISYANDVNVHTVLTSVSESHRQHINTVIRSISASGGTNLGGGLHAGIETLINTQKANRVGKVILVSDGLANHGITDPNALGKMAAQAITKEFTISTVGVGNDFNEVLMTAIADRGAGTYHYLENPAAFAAVFEKEFREARAVAAKAVTVNIGLPEGVRLTQAAGFPVETTHNRASFYPGNLLSGQSRTFYLDFIVPTIAGKSVTIDDISVSYMRNDTALTNALKHPFVIACVTNAKEALMSVNKAAWTQKVIESDYNRLKEEVAQEIKAGNEQEAISKINTYQSKQQALNAVIDSSQVADNLEKDVDELRQSVTDTFTGKPAAIERKQKANAKKLQYEGYAGRRKK